QRRLRRGQGQAAVKERASADQSVRVSSDRGGTSLEATCHAIDQSARGSRATGWSVDPGSGHPDRACSSQTRLQAEYVSVLLRSEQGGGYPIVGPRTD